MAGRIARIDRREVCRGSVSPQKTHFHEPARYFPLPPTKSRIYRAHCWLDISVLLIMAGEMLDWEAPTGGYLLTACLASGRRAGEGALAWLATLKR